MPTTEWILRNRPPLLRPTPGDTLLGQLDEWEPSGPGLAPAAVRVRTLFLRGSECRFHCTMCDLWRHTHSEATRPGDIPMQIAKGLQDIQTISPAPTWLKLYNAASFFDSKNIPAEDVPQIAQLVQCMNRIVIENHPRLTLSQSLAGFVELIQPAQLEVAMGLETAEPEVLRKLNKQMTVDDFRRAVEICHRQNVFIRAFVLLQPPWLDRASALSWCQATIDVAREMGVQHVSVIPVRAGNGALEQLAESGEFVLPTAAMLETILKQNLSNEYCLVTVDLWDWDVLRGTCSACSHARCSRLAQMNLQRQNLPPVLCEKCDVRESID